MNDFTRIELEELRRIVRMRCDHLTGHDTPPELAAVQDYEFTRHLYQKMCAALGWPTHDATATRQQTRQDFIDTVAALQRDMDYFIGKLPPGKFQEIADRLAEGKEIRGRRHHAVMFDEETKLPPFTAEAAAALENAPNGELLAFGTDGKVWRYDDNAKAVVEITPPQPIQAEEPEPAKKVNFREFL